MRPGIGAKELSALGTILDEIVATKRSEVARAKEERPLAELQSAVRGLPDPRGFFEAAARPPRRAVNLIAEIKKQSPSAGLIRADFDPAAIASLYHAAGADALSVLTDGPYFDGRLAFLDQVKAAVPLPVLRKDFMIDPYQIYESRAAGADAVLLIGEVLEPTLLRDMLGLAYDLGMTSLIEVHEVETFERLQTAIRFPDDRRSLLGVNNRNLKIQKTDLATTEVLARLIPPGVVLVSESGVQTRADVERLARAGARALLIGETFMRAPDIAAKVTELLGRFRD
jgi:indole-3-glycerol phosphate synthase